jgi:hypothetical protein
VCLCWRPVLRLGPPGRWETYRQRTSRPARELRSMTRRSPTSAWGRSTSSTKRTPGRHRRASNLPEVVVAAAAAEVAAEAAGAVEVAEVVVAAVAAAVAAAVCHGASAPSARDVTFDSIDRPGSSRSGFSIWCNPDKISVTAAGSGMFCLAAHDACGMHARDGRITVKLPCNAGARANSGARSLPPKVRALQ